MPEQERSRRTYAQILDAAAVLLEETGIEGFNTNLLAERADVRIRTVYRYFPNKLAVVTALAERMVTQWGGWFDALEQVADAQADWKPVWRGLIDAYVQGIKAVPGGVALRRAMHAVAELRAIDQRDNAILAARVAQVFATRLPHASRKVLETQTRVLLETAAAIVDLSLNESPAGAAALIAALKEMHVSCMDQWFTQHLLSRGKGGRARPRG